MEEGAHWPSALVIPELGRIPMKIRSGLVLWWCQKMWLHVARVSTTWQLLELTATTTPF